MGYLALFITVPLTFFALLFAVSNPQNVDVRIWPFDGAWTMSLYIVGLGLLGVGFFCGALFVWLHSQKTQFSLWREKRRAAKLEKELAALQKKEPVAEIKKDQGLPVAL